MTRTEKTVNLFAVILPFAATIAAVPLLWNSLVGPTDLAILAVMYLLTAGGITIGYHRLLTHRSFQTSKPLEYLFAALGSMAVQGPVISWVADHRKHHAHTDTDGDPHSPHVGHGDGPLGVMRGLWHAHTGWLFSEQGRAHRSRYAPDLTEDAGMRLLSRRFPIEDQSTNVFWLALPSLGEAWHHNHHAFPRSAVHGLRRWELDPSAAVIWTMEKLGLAWNVVRISPERQAQRAEVLVPQGET